ncbi:hypothetical protein FOL47_003039, partial [Perkinsus chesapeaki]
FSKDELGRLVVALLETLFVVHYKDLVHLDIKPGNFMLTQDGKLKIIDLDGAVPAGSLVDPDNSLVAFTAAGNVSILFVRNLICCNRVNVEWGSSPITYLFIWEKRMHALKSLICRLTPFLGSGSEAEQWSTYCSPELARSVIRLEKELHGQAGCTATFEASRKMDVWSLGVTICELFN